MLRKTPPTSQQHCSAQGSLPRSRPAAFVVASISILLVGLFLQFSEQSSASLPFQNMQHPPPAPLPLRGRTGRLRDARTGLPRQVPLEADPALDYFQKTFPYLVTQEHQLIKRWEKLSELFGGAQAANDLVKKDPSCLRFPPHIYSRVLNVLTMYLGPQMARDIIFSFPYILSKRGSTSMHLTLPAMLNVFGTKERVHEIIKKYPGLVHMPVSQFYYGMANMYGICGTPEKATAISKAAMDRIRRSPLKPLVPSCYPALVALCGGDLEAAHGMIDREPTILRSTGDQICHRLATLREVFGDDDAAQDVAIRMPFFFLTEENKYRKAMETLRTMNRIFGVEEARRRLFERPILLTIGDKLLRLCGFAEKKLGGIEAVRDQFESVLERTGMIEEMDWEMKPRPRSGQSWSPILPRPEPRITSWTYAGNPLGKGAPPRGRWDAVEGEDEEDEARGWDVVEGEDEEDEARGWDDLEGEEDEEDETNVDSARQVLSTAN